MGKLKCVFHSVRKGNAHNIWNEIKKDLPQEELNEAE